MAMKRFPLVIVLFLGETMPPGGFGLRVKPVDQRMTGGKGYCN
jgi:hypothetical protein